jgi:hypothetical protein
MANKKFSEFTVKTDPANVDFLVGYDGTDNVRIDPANLGGGGASDLNGLTDCLVDTLSLYVGEVPSSLSGNPQGNLIVGVDAGNALTSGANNTLLGNNAGKALTTAASNVIIGKNAGLAKTSGSNATIIGTSAGRDTASGSYVVLIGAEAGISNTGDNAIAIGFEAGRVNTATSTISIGYHAGYSQTSGAQSTNIGFEAGYSNTTGAFRTCVGYQAGKLNTGTGNTFIGQKAGGSRANSEGGCTAVGNAAGRYWESGSNTALGENAGQYANGTSRYNVMVGREALGGSFGSKSNNVAVGYKSGFAVTTGGNNTLMGFEAGNSVTTGSNLTIIGYDADASSATATNEITLGNTSVTSFRIPGIQSGASDGDVLTFNSSAGKLELQAAGGGGATDLNGLSDCLVDTDSLYVGEVPSGLSGNPQGNTVLGIDCGNALTTGTLNTFFGRDAGKSATSALSNTFFGAGAGQSLTTNFNNCLFGVFAGQNITGRDNVGIGNIAFRFGGGDYNVCIGSTAGTGVNSGDYNTMVGTLTDGGSGNNNTLLGNGATRSSNSVNNEITLGNSSITSLRCAVTSITSLSDERDKSEIKDLEYGLAFIDALQPREFVWNNRAETRPEFDEDGNETEVEFYSANKGKKDFGFIAQEVRELDNDTLRLVYTENEEKLEMSYGKLVPILVKAIQELKEEVELLKS